VASNTIEDEDCDFRPITSCISDTVRDIVTEVDYITIVCPLSNYVVTDDLG